MPIHQGSIGAGPAGDLAAIVSDPARYKAEIEKLTALREEVESKMRAVATESDAQALKESAKRELENAVAHASELKLQAEKAIKDANDVASHVVEMAKADAARMAAEVTAALNSAHSVMAQAESKKNEVENHISALAAAKTMTDNMAKDYAVAMAQHQAAMQLHHEARGKLEGIAKTIVEALK